MKKTINCGLKNNKGFSMVEIIVVIAIIAILSAALAPKLLKYLEKARIDHDLVACDTIEKTIYTALSDDEFHDIAAENAQDDDIKKFVMCIIPDYVTEGEIYIYDYNCDSLDTSALTEEVKTRLLGLKAPKETFKKSYMATVRLSKQNMSVVIGEESYAYAVDEIDVFTSDAYDNADIERKAEELAKEE